MKPLCFTCKYYTKNVKDCPYIKHTMRQYVKGKPRMLCEKYEAL